MSFDIDQDEIARLKKQLDEEEARKGKPGYMRWSKGEHQVRLLPPGPGKKVPWKEVYTVFGLGPNSKPATLAEGQRSPALEAYRKQFEGKDDELSKRKFKSLTPKKRYLFPAIRRAEPELGVQIWSCTKNTWKEIFALICHPDFQDLTHPERGTDLTVTYNPKNASGFAEFGIQPRRDRTPIDIPEEDYNYDLFEKWILGNPSEEEYIEACIAGRENEYFEKLKKERDAQRLDELNNSLADVEAPGDGSGAPDTPSTSAAVAKALADLEK